ncbi:MAG: hypothetical protein QME51_06050 [Planctomycetota bacterium]|nr:hypothetical protein [Planctomycetota bacterium]MDI6787915.1 hypothetical protein [Planctomycetota bacterium]
MAVKLNYLVIVLVLLLVGFTAHLGYRKITSADELSSGKSPIPISQEHYRRLYLEFLRGVLILNVKVQNDTFWIYITNRSPDTAIPSGEPSRVIVCTTELISLDNKLISHYPIYFKMASPEEGDDIFSQQIAPASTAKFGYVLTIPHGIIRVKLTYEDYSPALRGEKSVVSLVEKEITF